jgi:hypothetical protein
MPRSKKPKRKFNAKRSRDRVPLGKSGFRGNQFMIEKVLAAADRAPKGKG